MMKTNLQRESARNDRLFRPFSITSVSRSDILSAGIMTEKQALKISDRDMGRIASKMADAYCESVFWIDLPIIVEAVVKDNT